MKNKFFLKKKALIIFFSVFLLLVLFLFLQVNKNSENSSLNYKDYKEEIESKRETYDLPEIVFSELPEMPKDFNLVVEKYKNGFLKEESFFSEKYYLQPEFYPSFLNHGINYWKKPITTHWGAYGYGSYPSKKSITMNKGMEKEIVFFVYSGYGVRSYQGMKLEVLADESFLNCFQINLKEEEFLLSPNFPYFTKNWAKDVRVNLVSSKECSPKTYSFSVIIKRPSEKKSKDWKKIAEENNKPYFDFWDLTAEKPIYEATITIK